MKTKSRRRKLPITSTLKSSNALSSSSSANPLTSARLIRHFHVLLKRRAQLEKRKASKDNAKELREIEEEIKSMGGLEAYQRMSSIGQSGDRGGGSEKVLISWLKELKVQDAAMKAKRRTRLLEVGALKPDNYALCNAWIDALAIDLRSRHPEITEQDFLLMDQETHANKWDIISLSLVVNFAPDAHDRGRMLKYSLNMLRDGGHLFLVLPTPCVANSRYLTSQHLADLMQFIGFDMIRERAKEGGKMAYWLYRKRSADHVSVGSDEELHASRGSEAARFSKKLVLRDGRCNNFCILL